MAPASVFPPCSTAGAIAPSPVLREALITRKRRVQGAGPSPAGSSSAIAAELHGVPRQTVDTVPGLGPVFTAGIVAELSDVRRFEHEESVAKFAGLTWHRHQSGEFEGEDRPLTRTANAYLRYYLIEGANSVRLNCPEFRSYYDRKFREVTRHQHRRALVLTARKLVRLVDSLLRSGQIYLSPGARKAS